MNEPIEISFNTFELIAKKRGGYSNKNKKLNNLSKANALGKGSRFGLTKQQKWKAKVAKWNKNRTDNLLDPNRDVTPGPDIYSSITRWVKQKGDPDLKGSNLFRATSTGPKMSVYYK